MTMILKFDELGPMAQEKYLNHARLLIDKEYVKTLSVRALAEEIYDSEMKNRSTNPKAPLGIRPYPDFVQYNKDEIWRDYKDDEKPNWLK